MSPYKALINLGKSFPRINISHMTKCTDLNFAKGLCVLRAPFVSKMLDYILILIFDHGTVKTSNTHRNRQQIPQHWHQETADTSKTRELESLLYDSTYVSKSNLRLSTGTSLWQCP